MDKGFLPHFFAYSVVEKGFVPKRRCPDGQNYSAKRQKPENCKNAFVPKCLPQAAKQITLVRYLLYAKTEKMSTPLTTKGIICVKWQAITAATNGKKYHPNETTYNLMFEYTACKRNCVKRLTDDECLKLSIGNRISCKRLSNETAQKGKRIICTKCRR